MLLAQFVASLSVFLEQIVAAYLNARARSSPANVMANYGELEKSGKFLCQTVRLG